jgi:threonine synthase
MDILVSSNLERLLYLLSGDPALVAELMKQLNTDGHYTVPQALREQISESFWAGCCSDAQARNAILQVWQENAYLTDPHTACGWQVAQDYVNQTGDTRPMVVLSTASAYKFPSAVLEALQVVGEADEFDQMEQLERLTGAPIPENLRTLRTKAERHTGVIEKDEMLDFVLQACK